MLRRIFGLKRDEVTGEWRRLHNEELCALYQCYSTWGTRIPGVCEDMVRVCKI